MKTPFLFPPALKKVGWFLFIPGLMLGILCLYFNYQIPWLDAGTKESTLFDFTDHNYTNELAGVLVLGGLMLISFSRRRDEDEFIANMRLDALLWAVYANSLVLILCILLVHGGTFVSVLVYNLFTVPVIYLLRFQYLLYTSLKESTATA